MNRIDFSHRLGIMLNAMSADSEQVILDYLIRSKEEQQRLYKIGRSFNDKGEVIFENSNRIVTKCDGIIKKSAHQYGKAIDIYFADENGNPIFGFENDKNLIEKYKKWHDFWVGLGGKELIEWDCPHFELS